MLEVVALLLVTLRALLRGHRDLTVENLMLRQQLAVLTRSTRKRPRLGAWDKAFWLLARRCCADWRRHLVLVRPETVVRWHRQGWRLFWRWRSRTRLGRPRVSTEIRELIRTMSRANPLWGAERIRGELLKLGIAVSNRSVRRYRGRPARPPSQTWRTFLRNHAAAIWAADFFTVQTLTFKTLYVLLFITHDRRELVHLAVTAHPTAAWVWCQLIAATPWGRAPRYLVRDRDGAYGGDFVGRARGVGIETLLTPVRAPRANALAERVVRTLRAECLDHIIVANEAHLRAVLSEFAAYYNAERPHRSLHLEPPVPAQRGAAPFASRIHARPVLGGLHHVYERVA
jgi:transposase InsO family protein